MKKTASRHECQQCNGWKHDKRGHMAAFTVGGIWHYAPDMWLASRSLRYGSGLQAFTAASVDWAHNCAMQDAADKRRVA